MSTDDIDIGPSYENEENPRQVSTSKRSSVALTLHDDRMETGSVDVSVRPKSAEDTNDNESHTLVVDWEGPDDPENPKK
jgi:hypothetical protein